MNGFDSSNDIKVESPDNDGSAALNIELRDAERRFSGADHRRHGLGVPQGGFLPVMGLYLGLRFALFLCNVLAAEITGARNWLTPFTAWDGHWYTQVAEGWYGSTALSSAHLTYAAGGFEPGWPAFIKLGTMTGLSFAASAFVMSLLVGGATVFAIWRLSRELLPERPEMATVAVLAFPGAAVVFGIAYSEVLSIGCVAATLFLLIKRRWVLAGIAATIASATSSLAVVLTLVCLIEAFLAIRDRREYRSLWALAIAPVGFLGFVGYLGFLAKDPLYWWRLQSHAWGAKIEPGYIFHWFRSFAGTGWGAYWMAAAGLVVLVYLVVNSFRSDFPLSVKLYCAAVAVMVLINPALGPKPRFLFWLFPAILLFPRDLKPRLFNSVLIVMAWLLPLLLIAYTTIGNTVAQP